MELRAPATHFAETPDNPIWKVVVFFATLYSACIALWPLFLRSWFPKTQEAVTPKYKQPEFTVPKTLLTRRMDDEEIENWRWDFRTHIQDGDEWWEFSSPAHSWKHLAGRAGIAIVRNGEIVTSRVTKMN